MKSDKNNNKSLFLYTALIFIVALVMIILSFFGQSRMQENQPQLEPETMETTPPVSGSITERAAALSEDNRVLLEENNSLKEEIQLAEENAKKADEARKAAEDKNKQYDLLLSAYGYFTVDNYEMSRETLAKINYDALSTDMKLLYDRINENIN